MSQTDPHRRPRRSALACLAIVVALLVSACGPATSSVTPASAGGPSPSVDADAIYDTVEKQVIAIRGLQPVKPVDRQFINKTELRTIFTKLFDEETPPDYLAANDRLYKALGLIPATSNLRNLYLDLYSSGVAAFYRSEEGKLYVVSQAGEPGATERFYFAHEYDHALQDQNSTIFKDQDGVLDQGDRILARQAIYEGDATLLMTQWGAANLSQAELLEVLTASDPEAQAIVARTPAILRETLLFPYNVGFTYVNGVQTTGGWPAVDAYFKAMPESTEQILHPAKYTAHEAPVKVTLPGRSRDGARSRLDSAVPGHVRRVPVGDLAARA